MSINFEVYYGQAGIWQRLVMPGSVSRTDIVPKIAFDTVRPTSTDFGSMTPRLSKAGADMLLAAVVDAGAIVASGTTAKPGTDSVRVAVTESAFVLTTSAPSTDTAQIALLETASVFQSTVSGTAGPYGAGIYGSGPYGTGAASSVGTDYPGVTLYPGFELG